MSIPPILEHGDTDNWEDEDSIEVDSEKKQSRKRYLRYPTLVFRFQSVLICLRSQDKSVHVNDMMNISGYGRRMMMPEGGPGGVARDQSLGTETSLVTVGSSSGTSQTPQRLAQSRAGGSRSGRRATAPRG